MFRGRNRHHCPFPATPPPSTCPPPRTTISATKRSPPHPDLQTDGGIDQNTITESEISSVPPPPTSLPVPSTGPHPISSPGPMPKLSTTLTAADAINTSDNSQNSTTINGNLIRRLQQHHHRQRPRHRRRKRHRSGGRGQRNRHRSTFLHHHPWGNYSPPITQLPPKKPTTNPSDQDTDQGAVDSSSDTDQSTATLVSSGNAVSGLFNENDTQSDSQTILDSLSRQGATATPPPPRAAPPPSPRPATASAAATTAPPTADNPTSNEDDVDRGQRFVQLQRQRLLYLYGKWERYLGHLQQLRLGLR